VAINTALYVNAVSLVWQINGKAVQHEEMGGAVQARRFLLAQPVLAWLFWSAALCLQDVVFCVAVCCDELVCPRDAPHLELASLASQQS
jgi:hypothetical protein